MGVESELEEALITISVILVLIIVLLTPHIITPSDRMFFALPIGVSIIVGLLASVIGEINLDNDDVYKKDDTDSSITSLLSIERQIDDIKEHNGIIITTFIFITLLFFVSQIAYHYYNSQNYEYAIVSSILLFVSLFIIPALIFSVFEPLRDFSISDDKIKLTYRTECREIRLDDIESLEAKRKRINIREDDGTKHRIWVHNPEEVRKILITKRL